MATTPPSSQQHPREPRPALKPLVDQLARLTDEERQEVVAAAEHAARTQRNEDADAARQRRWDWLWGSIGIVSLGGNAIEDCERLYDDA